MRTMRRIATGLVAALPLLLAATTAHASLTTTAERGYLGVQIAPNQEHVEIQSVLPGTAADRGGLVAGDQVLAIDGAAVDSIEALGEAIATKQPGSAIKMKIRRSGEVHVLSLTLGHRDPPEDRVEPTPKPGTVLPAPRTVRPGGPRGPVSVDPAPTRGWLGVYVEPNDRGLRIDGTVDGGPAAAAGLAADDIIVSVDDEEIVGTEGLLAALERAGANRSIDVTVIRGMTPRQFEVKLLPHPDDAADAPVAAAPPARRITETHPAPERPRGWLGIYLTESEHGVAVESVVEGGPAAGAGLASDDVIISIGGREIPDLEALREALGRAGAGTEVAVTVLRGQTPREFDVTLGRNPEAPVAAAPAISPLRRTTPPTTVTPRTLPGQERRARGPITARPPVAATPPAAPQPPSATEAPRGGGFLGVMIESDSEGLARVADVRPGSPAEKGKLAAGDIIVALDGKNVSTADALKSHLAKVPAGTEIEVTVDRGGEHHHRIVRLAGFDELDWNQAPPPPTAGGLFGARRGAVARSPAPPVEPTPPSASAPEKRGYLGVSIEDADGGVRISEVHADTAAARAGLRPGDLITRVGEHRVRNTDQLLESMSKHPVGAKVEIRVERGEQVIETMVKLGERPNVAVADADEPRPEATPTFERRRVDRSAAQEKRDAERTAQRAKRAAAAEKAVAMRELAQVKRRAAMEKALASEAVKRHAGLARRAAPKQDAKTPRASVAKSGPHTATVEEFVFESRGDGDDHGHGHEHDGAFFDMSDVFSGLGEIIELESGEGGAPAIFVLRGNDGGDWVEERHGAHGGDHEFIIVKKRTEGHGQSNAGDSCCHHCCHHCCCCHSHHGGSAHGGPRHGSQGSQAAPHGHGAPKAHATIEVEKKPRVLRIRKTRDGANKWVESDVD